MKTIKLQLVVDVTYNVRGGETVESLVSRLGTAADRMAEQGLLSGDGPSTVKTWDANVEIKSSKPGPNKAIPQPTRKDVQKCKDLMLSQNLAPLKAVAMYVKANPHLAVTTQFVERVKCADNPAYRPKSK